MISYYTIYTLIIWDGISRSELNYDFFVTVTCDGAFDLVEWENVVRVSEKLELGL
jgi:hypothetical protein